MQNFQSKIIWNQTYNKILKFAPLKSGSHLSKKIVLFA